MCFLSLFLSSKYIIRRRRRQNKMQCVPARSFIIYASLRDDAQLGRRSVGSDDKPPRSDRSPLDRPPGVNMNGARSNRRLARWHVTLFITHIITSSLTNGAAFVESIPRRARTENVDGLSRYRRARRYLRRRTSLRLHTPRSKHVCFVVAALDRSRL